MASQYQVLSYINICLICLQGLVIFVLYHNTIRYVRSFGSKQDPYTVGTLLLLGLSTIVLLCSLPFLIINKISDPSVVDWRNNHQELFICSLLSSKIFSKVLFTLAILVNSTRWALLIISVKTTSRRQECLFKLSRYSLLVSIFILLALTLAGAIVECKTQGSPSSETRKQIELLVSIVANILSVFSLLIYFAAYKIFLLYFREHGVSTDSANVSQANTPKRVVSTRGLNTGTSRSGHSDVNATPE